MNDHPEQPSTDGQSDPISGQSPSPFFALQDPPRKSIRSRARWIVPALLLSASLLVWALWAGQPYWEYLSQPRVTVEVQGMH
jgi:hypothetical protein